MFEPVLMIMIACGFGSGSGCDIHIQSTDLVICERAQKQIADDQRASFNTTVKCVSTRIN